MKGGFIMEDIVLDCYVERKESTKKPGVYYYQLVVELTPECKKTVFLTNVEAELLKLTYGSK